MVVTIFLKISTKHLHFIFQHFILLGEENYVELFFEKLKTLKLFSSFHKLNETNTL